MTKAFDGIAAGVADAIAFAKGNKTKGSIVAGPGCPAKGEDKGHSLQN